MVHILSPIPQDRETDSVCKFFSGNSKNHEKKLEKTVPAKIVLNRFFSVVVEKNTLLRPKRKQRQTEPGDFTPGTADAGGNIVQEMFPGSTKCF